MSFLETNYHTHTYRCKHASGLEEEYIEAAIRMGIKVLGFSDHIPCPFKDGYVSNIRMDMEQAKGYVETIRTLGQQYSKDITLYVGFEAEYIPEFYEEQMDMCRRLGCDYLIMGQHFWENEAKGPYAGNVTEDENRMRSYVDSIIEGMKTGSYCCLAHPDLIHYEGMDSVYEWEMTRLCKAMKEKRIPLELNVLGALQDRHYPKESFWQIAGQIGNDVILGIDAHSPEQIMNPSGYEKCMRIIEKYNLNLIKELGFGLI